jgi:thioredoxin reductase
MARQDTCTTSLVTTVSTLFFPAGILNLIKYIGTVPEQFRGLAREQISRYPTAQIKYRTATSIVPQNNGSSFLTTDNSGQTYSSRKIILATGLRDILPATPGIKEAWSRGIFWCPWCDGFEHRDEPFGILGSILDVVGSVLEVATLNKDIIAFVNGTYTDENVAKLNVKRPGWQKQLTGYGVKLENRTITSIERLQDGAIVQDVTERKEYDEFRVHLADGSSFNRSAFITNFPSQQRSYIGQPLGVKYYGEKISVDAGSMRTDVPGVYAVGDANSDNSTNVPHAMFSGKKAAVYVHGKSTRMRA